MGIVGMPKISFYWSKNKLHAGSCISSVTTRERLEIILRCLHFKNTSIVDDPLDTLFKLRPLVTKIRDQCQAVYKPGHMAVNDESTASFRGWTKVRDTIFLVKHINMASVVQGVYSRWVYMEFQDSFMQTNKASGTELNRKPNRTL